MTGKGARTLVATVPYEKTVKEIGAEISHNVRHPSTTVTAVLGSNSTRKWRNWQTRQT